MADWADRIVATGAVSNVRVSGYLKELSGYSVGDFQTGFAPNQAPVRMVLTVGPGGISGSNSTGVQPRAYYEVDDDGRVLLFRPDFAQPSVYVRYTYGADGLPATVQDRYGTVTYGTDANGDRAVVSDNRTGAPAGIPVGEAPAPDPSKPRPTGWAEVAWDGAVTVYADAAGQAADLAVTLYKDIQVAGETVHAWAYEQWTKAGETVTWAYDAATGPVLAIGSYAVAATKEAAERFVDRLAAYGGTFADLLAKLDQFGAAAKDVLQALVTDPGTFLTRLGASVGKGIEDFFGGLGTTLKSSLLAWATKGLAGIPDPTTVDWTNPQKAGAWLLDFFKLNWDGIQGLLVQKLGAGNVALVTQAYEYIQPQLAKGTAEVFNWLKQEGAALTPQELLDKAIDAGVDFVVRNVVPPVVAAVAAKFVPGANILSTVYGALTWVADNLERVEGLAALGTTIALRIGAVARGEAVTVQVAGEPDRQVSAADVLAGEVKSFLDGLVPVVLSFGISQVPGMGRVPAQVVGFIERVRDLPLAKAGQALDKMAAKAKELLGLTGPNASQYRGLIGKPVAFRLGNEEHRIWAVNQNGQSGVMAASTAELERSRDSLVQHFRQIRIRRDAPQAYQAAGTAFQAVQTAIDAVKPLEANLSRLGAINNPTPSQEAERKATFTAYIAAQKTASERLDDLGLLLVRAQSEIKAVADQYITIPPSEAAPANVTAEWVAQQLPTLTAGTRHSAAEGALVVGGRIYWLTTGASYPDPITGRTYQDPAVSRDLTRSGARLGFQAASRNHIEQSAAGILLRMRLRGENVSGAFVVVNKDEVCQGILGCDQNLQHSLPVGVALQVFTVQVMPNRNMPNVLNTTGHPYMGL